MAQFKSGDMLPQISLDSIKGHRIMIPDENHYTYLAFRRFAGCPVCNLHMAQLQKGQGAMQDANIKTILVFYSRDSKMQELLSDIPFGLVADPSRKLYAQFGVDRGFRAILTPSVWPHMMRAVYGMGKRILSSIPASDESVLGLPADFLIAPDGRIIAAKYGVHAYDQWSVQNILQHKK